MYQQIFIYQTPDRTQFRYISEPKEVKFIPEINLGTQLELTLPGEEEASRFCVVALPRTRHLALSADDKVPVTEFYLAPWSERELYTQTEELILVRKIVADAN